MKIAIIGWGSLVWDPRTLPYKGDWQTGGPELSIEFSRVSSDCRLTLVVDGKFGDPVGTRFVLSKRRELHDAIADLRDREGTIWSRIGYVDLSGKMNSNEAFSQQDTTLSTVETWAKKEGFNAAVWTALPPSFEKETGEPFSVKNATEYIRALPVTAREVAIEYLNRAPAEVSTPLRRHLAQERVILPTDRWGVT